jgi:hypothetical protein
VTAFGGTSPVQGEGTVCGWEWYFRARYNSWSIQVTDGSVPVLEVEETTEKTYLHDELYEGVGEFRASYMPTEVAQGFILRELTRCRDEVIYAPRPEYPTRFERILEG